MIIKTFRAETSSAALKRVREEMGGDAIVLKTTQESSALGKIIYEVTACLENPSVSQTSKIFSDTVTAEKTHETTAQKAPETQVAKPKMQTPVTTDDVWQKRYEKLEIKINNFLDSNIPSLQSIAKPFDELKEQLHEHDFSNVFIGEFISELDNSYEDTFIKEIFIKEKLTEKLNQFISNSFSLQVGDKLAVVGPAGSGKSSVMGKLATTLVMKEKKKVTLLTLDDVKMGAYDETAAYAEILGTEYADNRTAIENSKNKDSVTLIDTVAMPNEVENIQFINDKLDEIGTSYRLAVFSAIMRSKDVIAMTKQIQAIHPTHLVITKTDMTECIGTLVTAAHAFDLKIIYTTDSHGGVGVLQTPQVDTLVNKILQLEVANE